MNKNTLFLIIILISAFIFINSVNATDTSADFINTTDNMSDSISSTDDCDDSVLSTEEVIKNGNTYYNQESTIIAQGSCDDDGKYWVDSYSSNLVVRVSAGGEYTSDGKIKAECDGETIWGAYYSNGYHIDLSNLVDVDKKTTKTIKISFIGNLYKLTNKKTGEVKIVPKAKNSTLTIKIKTGTKSVYFNNGGKLELNSYEYANLKSDFFEEFNVYNVPIVTGTTKKLYKTTWKKKLFYALN